MALTDTQAKSMKPKDKDLADGTVTGLYLVAGSKKGHGNWKLRFVSPESNKRRDAGLGSYPEISISEARKRGNAYRELLARKIDPIEEARRNEREAAGKRLIPTFQSAAEATYESKKDGWENGKHAGQWINTLKTHVFPTLGKRTVDTLRVEDFAEALKPIWTTNRETAARVKQRCKLIMDWCFAHGHVSFNPVSLVEHLLPKHSRKANRKHHPSLPWPKLPDFFAEVFSSSRWEEKHDRQHTDRRCDIPASYHGTAIFMD